jgi:hypothetical protein
VLADLRSVDLLEDKLAVRHAVVVMVAGWHIPKDGTP